MSKQKTLFDVQNSNELLNLCGIDEAGRGPIAGPLVIVGCILGNQINQLDDSKKLSEKKRNTLYKIIKNNAKIYIYTADNKKIDSLGISKCIKEGLLEIKEYFKNDTNNFLFDGNSNFAVDGIKTLIKADSKVKAVSAASIIAKVYRDNIMLKLHNLHPQYNFKKNKGYGTKEHINAIKKYGYCEVHRVSFKLKELLQESLF